MREIFNEIFGNQPLDPTEAASRGTRPQLRTRFYRRAQVLEDKGFTVQLDGRPIHTPARRRLVAPTRPLAEAIAAEWEGQTTVIDPARMPLTRLANAAIDAVAENTGAVANETAKYLACDLLCYRAATPAGLVERQAEHWDPVLAWARGALGADFVVAQGVTHVEQPGGAIAAARAKIPTEPWRLAAVSSITTLTGSALLALALSTGATNADAAWAAAHVDEDWQMAKWGRDELALARRRFHRADFDAAATVLSLVTQLPPSAPRAE